MVRDEVVHRTDIRGHRILIVGAASGIGRAAAGLLTRLGADVIVADRDTAGLSKVAEKLSLRRGVEVDVTNEDSVRTATEAIIADGQLHALVNCAGVTGITGVDSDGIPIEDFRAVVDINLSGAFLLSKAVLPHMVEQQYGRIVHVSSMAGKEGNPGMVSYSASKAGLIGMVKAMGKEYATTGVTINALAPVTIQTPMVDAMPASQVDYMRDRIPAGRLGTLEEVALALYWAVTPATSFTTGFVYDLSGGRAVY